jgi:hypothetical protein
MRFRPRFSLRTLFVLVAIIGVALGLLYRERRIVAERKRLFEEIASKTFLGEMRIYLPYMLSAAKPPKVTWLQRQLGDYDYGAIVLPYDASEDMIQRTKHLFSHAYQMGPLDKPFVLHELK